MGEKMFRDMERQKAGGLFPAFYYILDDLRFLNNELSSFISALIKLFYNIFTYVSFQFFKNGL
jgi:hypothetical protein